jgi:hypothetical protein
MDPTFWATIGSVIVAVAAVLVAYVGLKRQLKQNYAIVGAQSAIEWREQVFDLHDRGLSPEEIRYIMYLERGGKEYEWQNGLIDEVVGNVPRKALANLSDPPGKSAHRATPRPDKVRSWKGGY